MLKFLATTENIRNITSEEPIYNRGKVVEKKAAENCYSQFPDIRIHESRAVFETEDRAIANKRETD